ncbi:hypothetical protein HY993_03615, partial [Candidatus Micrarchaeota archaeon]|nr:hypothetical protein [Candidatus Micrarchaeota archaeon]
MVLMVYPDLTKQEQEEANKLNEEYKKKAVFWHNSIPNFNHNMRASLTEDLSAIVNVQQLELNKKLSEGVEWNNRIQIALGMLYLGLLLWYVTRLMAKYRFFLLCYKLAIALS